MVPNLPFPPQQFILHLRLKKQTLNVLLMTITTALLHACSQCLCAADPIASNHRAPMKLQLQDAPDSGNQHSRDKRKTIGDRPRGSQCPELEDHDCVNDQLTVDPEIVWDLLLQLDPYKSMRPDGINLKILKKLPDVITKPLSVFEHSQECREVPADWRLDKAVTVFKKGKKEDPRNDKPVSQSHFSTWSGTKVTVNWVTSDWDLGTSGAPQGSILCPVLLNIFINDLDARLEVILNKLTDDTNLGGAAALKAGTPCRETSTNQRTEQTPIICSSKREIMESSDRDMYRQFQDWCLRTYGDSGKTKTVTRKKYDRIVQLLNGSESSSTDNAKFKFWVKSKGFQLGNSDEVSGGAGGGKQVLYVPVKTTDGVGVDEKLSLRRVAVVEDFFDIIYSMHVETGPNGEQIRKHAGQKRTYKAISETYAFLPREAVTRFLMSCSECQKRMHLNPDGADHKDNGKPPTLVTSMIDYNMPITMAYMKHMKLQLLNSQQDEDESSIESDEFDMSDSTRMSAVNSDLSSNLEERMQSPQNLQGQQDDMTQFCVLSWFFGVNPVCNSSAGKAPT
ncbi:hypothetical protein TURU_018659 [Turdus rufiventris]|nr:hypothetical protein TURU_018659 [Turdus rufiventris]